MNKKELIKKITKKKEFSELALKDVLLAFGKFENKNYSDEEKVKLTRALLRKSFSCFFSKRIFSVKNFERILNFHTSTRERKFFYNTLYSKILDSKTNSLIDLGAGVNGLSFLFAKKNINYLAIESIGQFVDLMNEYFKLNNFSAKAVHLSLFDIEKLKKEILKTKKPRVILLLKVVDSLELLKKDYSKTLILEMSNFSDKLVVSFSMRSLSKKEKFKSNKKWLIDFIKKNFIILDDFKLGTERYLVFK